MIKSSPFAFCLASFLFWVHTLNPWATSPQPSSCSAPLHETEIMSSFLKKLELPHQKKTVSGKLPSVVSGTMGTKLYIKPVDLETESGNPVGDQIVVELLELTNQSALMRCNAQTVSDGKLLVSGGSYHIAMYSNGEQLRLKSGKSLAVDLPKLSNDPSMSLFYGTKTTDGINWKPSGQTMPVAYGNQMQKQNKKYVPNNDNVVDEINLEEETEIVALDEAIQSVYQAVKLANLGWINVDKFYNEPNLISMALNFPKETKVARVFIAFKSMNSVLSLCYRQNENTRLDISSLPSGKPVRLIVIEQREGATNAFYRDLSLQNGASQQITFASMSETEVQKIFTIN